MDRYETFRVLHASGCFVIPNPWDVGSARLLEQMGFRALASTSAGFAWSIGRRDRDVTLYETLAHLRAVANAVTVPVNADFRDGFAVEPEGVAANVVAAAATGVAGLSIEDSTHASRRTPISSDNGFGVPGASATRLADSVGIRSSAHDGVTRGTCGTAASGGARFSAASR